ncbi:MAG: hypothetical protein H7203_11360, partial [Rhizobacter sp.]|nr:hypothetical protein [Burkholderiales bacterium]
MVFSAIGAAVIFGVVAGGLFSSAASAAIVQYNNADQSTFVGLLATGYYQENTWPDGQYANPYVRSGGTPLFTLSATAPTSGIYNSLNALSTNAANDPMTVALTTGAPTAFGAKVFASDLYGNPIAGSVTVTVTTNQASTSVVITSTATTTLATASFVGFTATGAGEVITSVTFLATQTAAQAWPSVSTTYVGRYVVNGVCGSANGVAVHDAPNANLCAPPSSTRVMNSGFSEFTWTCNGASTSASCAAPRTYTVTPSVVGGNGTATIPASGQVLFGAAGTVTITPNAGFATVIPVGGSCGGALAGSTYTTNPVTADCTVIASFVAVVNGACGTSNGVAAAVAPSANLCAAGTASAVTTAASQFTWACNGANSGSNASCAAPRTYTVTPSVSGGNGTASAASSVVAYNATGTVTITPNAGFVTATPVGGSCGGTLAGNTYTTNAVTADCTVIASLVPVVNGACGTANGVATGVAPSANLCAAGTASAVTTAASQFTWACNGANTGSNASCAAPRSYTVTPSVSGGNGTATIPASGVVAYNATGTVTITPNAGFVTATPVGGSCGGALAGSTYTTNAVTADCTVIASFVAVVNGACGSANSVAVHDAPNANLCAAGTASAVTTAASQFAWACNGANSGSNASCAAPRTYTVTPSVSGGNGTATIPASGVVAFNATGTVTITPDAGFVTATPVGGSCGGTLAGNTYTTNPVTADCTVIASFVAVVNGACGTTSGVATAVPPSANLCAAGTASAVTTAASQFTWACNGANTG